MTGGDIAGRLFDAGRSAAVPIVLRIESDGTVLAMGAEGAPVRRAYWHEVRVEPRIGDTPRQIAFPDGSVAEVSDNDVVDALERAFGGSGSRRWVAMLERRWTAALGSICLIVVAGWLLVAFGLPVLADAAAGRVPPGLATTLDRPVLDALSEFGLTESSLSVERRDSVQRLLDRLVAVLPDRGVWQFRLVFRGGKRLGANAFALPGGTIVVTDRLVQIAENDSEIAAVLAHEIGHVERRHGLKRLTRSAGLGVFALYFFGDATSLSHILASFPLFLINASYSRDFEREADAAAVGYLNRAGFPPRALIDMLGILARDCGVRCDVPGWLTDHPITPERIATLQKLIEQR